MFRVIRESLLCTRPPAADPLLIRQVADKNRASSILWHADFHTHRGIRCLPRKLLPATEKHGIARFLLHLYVIQGFSGSFLILLFIKQ